MEPPRSRADKYAIVHSRENDVFPMTARLGHRGDGGNACPPGQEMPKPLRTF
jgi:hypothetical protein